MRGLFDGGRGGPRGAVGGVVPVKVDVSVRACCGGNEMFVGTLGALVGGVGSGCCVGGMSTSGTDGVSVEYTVSTSTSAAGVWVLFGVAVCAEGGGVGRGGSSLGGSAAGVSAGSGGSGLGETIRGCVHHW